MKNLSFRYHILNSLDSCGEQAQVIESGCEKPPKETPQETEDTRKRKPDSKACCVVIIVSSVVTAAIIGSLVASIIKVTLYF